jgi:hypothetical protein
VAAISVMVGGAGLREEPYGRKRRRECRVRCEVLLRWSPGVLECPGVGDLRDTFALQKQVARSIAEEIRASNRERPSHLDVLRWSSQQKWLPSVQTISAEPGIPKRDAVCSKKYSVAQQEDSIRITGSKSAAIHSAERSL